MMRERGFGPRPIGLALLAVCMLGFAPDSRAQPAPAEDVSLMLPGDARQGWQIFFGRGCIECHSLWGEGGTSGPDLGRSTPTHLSASGLAAEIRNHVPAMHSKMEEERLQFASLKLEEMADLFAFLYFIRYMDEPGDPSKGLAVLREKRCTLCHSVQGQGGSVGPDLARWGNYLNPIVWAQRMWVNAPTMERAIRERGLEWPEINGDDMVHVIAYVRSVSSTTEKIYLEPGSPSRGRDLFVSQGCASCHPMSGKQGRGPDLGRVEIPRTLSQTAFLMWNHSPAMRQEMANLGIERKSMTAEQMNDIIAYLFAVRYFDPPGDAARGREVFRAKRCVTCHKLDGEGGEEGPSLDDLKGKASPIHLAQAMWNHGPQMLSKMSQLGIAWQNISPEEMVDLIECLRNPPQREKEESAKP